MTLALWMSPAQRSHCLFHVHSEPVRNFQPGFLTVVAVVSDSYTHAYYLSQIAISHKRISWLREPNESRVFMADSESSTECGTIYFALKTFLLLAVLQFFPIWLCYVGPYFVILLLSMYRYVWIQMLSLYMYVWILLLSMYRYVWIQMLSMYRYVWILLLSIYRYVWILFLSMYRYVSNIRIF
jgi:hypothetical protein